MTLFAPLAPAAAINPGDLDITFDTNGSINVNELFNQYVNVDKIKTDSVNRTVVLASYEDEYGFDNHILFRLNADGSYDNTFGGSGSLNDKNFVLVALTSSLYIFERVDLEIDSLGRMLVMLSGAAGFEFDSQYQSFVVRYLESGAWDPDFEEDGFVGSLGPQEGFPPLATDLVLDAPAGGNGFLTIGISFFTDGGGTPLTYLVIRKYDQDGQVDIDFGYNGVVEIDTEITFFSDVCLAEYCEVTPNDARIVPDNEGGYLIAYTGFYQSMDNSLPTTGLVRLDPDGLQDLDFAAGDPLPNDFLLAEFVDNQILLPFFIFTDIVPDGQDSFLISGTAVLFPTSAISLLFRLNTAGDLDLDFDVSASINGLNYNLSSPDPDDYINTDGIDCYNLALFRNENPSETSTAIIVGDTCDAGGFLVSGQSALFGFSQIGEIDQNFGEEGFVGLPNIGDNIFSSIITQLEPTKDGKLLVLRGAESTSGFLGFFTRLQSIDTSDGVVTISRYNLSQSVPAFTLTQATETATVGTAITSPIYSITSTVGSFNRYAVSPSLPTGITFDTSTALIAGTPQVSAGLVTYTVTGFTNINETATATFRLTINAAAVPPTPPAAPVVVYVAPTPVPYLKTLTTPKLNLKEGKLICTPGTYNAGYTLDGVVQGSTTALFTPSSFTYNLLINSITQTSLAVTSSNTSASWNIPASAAGALVTCSVTVSASGVTNTDKSSDNSSGVSTLLSTQTHAITTANAEYSAAVSANTKAYQKALVDNRAKWRSDTEKIRTDYYAERDRIKSLPSTKATRAQASAALKAYIAAQKKSAADYKASQPASATARDAANRAALDAKNAAIAKANAAYGTAIESIGYGVLIP